MTSTLALRWLRIKRHFRSFAGNPRAIRDADRGAAAAGRLDRPRAVDCLCR
jgi:hypothetical protein